MDTTSQLILAPLADRVDFDGWRTLARQFAAQEVPPERIVWQVGGEAADLFAVPLQAAATTPAGFSVPKPFISLAQSVICHRDPERFALLYTLLLRLKHQPRALEDATDPLIHRLEGMAKTVRRDIHKMRAFVRFRQVDGDADGRYIAWFEPEHHIVRANAGFFVRRFANMTWSILTPEMTIHWDGAVLQEGPGATVSDAPEGDPVEAQWKAYYASTFNPARLKIGAMLKEMPRKYWKNMPETALVSGLIAGAQARETKMIDTQIRKPDSPASQWDDLCASAAHCERCTLYKCASQTVFGEGPLDARIMLVGEQPGDQEDLTGRPFVGPAGKVLDEALAAAGLDRASLYVTNAVKHFKFNLRGKRRIHDKPNAGEIDVCRWWVDQERAIVSPQIIVALGATAARSVLGRTTTISKVRGQAIPLSTSGEAWVTVHPSYLLRIEDAVLAAEERQRFVEDLQTIRARLDQL